MKSCVLCHTQFDITADDLEFYAKIQVPPPTFCPECRFRRRCSFINVRNFYPRQIGDNKQPIMSMYSHDQKLNIVKDETWWSDEYDFLSYGKQYDFNNSFFSQFKSLLSEVPLPHLQRSFSTFQNSEYCNAASHLKNCYLIINADNSENCMFGFCVEECKDCLDVIFTNRSELCYETVNLKSCYSCMFCEDCEGSSNLLFCKDCVSCTDCFGCVGLRRKTNYIFNKPYSQEAYKNEISKLKTGCWSALEEMKKNAALFFLTSPQKYIHGRNNQNVHGDYIYQSKDVKDSYIVEMAEKCRYSHFLRYLSSVTHDAYDYTMFGVGADLVYESAWCGLGIHNVKFSLWNYGSSDIEYCIGCHYSSDLFGCIGLRHKKFCILNKQYSETDYKTLLPKIKKQMMQLPYVDSNGCSYGYGEFFPTDISPFYYNQTLAQDFCPLSEKQCVDLHYRWYYPTERKVEGFISWKELPDDIRNVEDSICKTAILCKAYDEDPSNALKHNCTQVYKITAQELEFYRKYNLPIPRYCYNSRHHSKLRQINPFKVWQRECNKCQKSIETTYGPEKTEIIYCEQCYLSHMY